jgi:PAS domain S-box-containing protein
MPGNNLRKFYLSIVLPSIMAIALFIISIFVVIIPSFERNIMDRKKEMISELTNTAWSLLEEYHLEEVNQKFSLEEAQQKAASRIQRIRYGVEHKDYFWIIDMHPTMIMHPYTTELINTDLKEYKDPNGKRLFVEATRVVSADGEGFIDYMWQWKDDSSRIVPKLSYVKEFAPWGWIVGTGIYLEDVKEEIWVIKKRLFGISLFISLTISVILLFVMRQSLKIEKKRKIAEAELLLSRQKYKSLVEASTEGTLMIVNQKIVFSNAKFNHLVGYDHPEITKIEIEDILELDWKSTISSMTNAQKSLSAETKIKHKDGKEKDVIISISQINYASDKGYIVITKEVSAQKRIEKETAHLASELQNSLLLMNQPIKPLINDILKCKAETPISSVAKLMTKRKRKILFVNQDQHIIGVVNDSDLKKRVLAQGLNTDQPVMNIMTSPIITINKNALMYEAILLLNNNEISHLAVTNEAGDIVGVIGMESITGLQQNSVTYLIKEIEVAEDVYQLTKIHQRVPALVNALVQSGDKTQNITRIITSVSDAITKRIISLAIEDNGAPPCDFAFMVMGSEGRKEQTLMTDQDNAIIFEETKNLEEAKKYFLKLGKLICGNLNEVGYKYCDGGIMAENPQWTQSLTGWKDHFSTWINNSDPQSILEASIFFDFRLVFGNETLVNKLRSHVNELTKNQSVFFYHLAQSITKYKAPVSLFGKIIDKEHSGGQVNLDIKKVLLPITSFIRLYALYHEVEATNSLDRISQLYQNEHISKDMYEELVLSHNYLMQLRFRFQSVNILQGQKPDNMVDIKNLTHIEVSTIKKIFGEITNLQTKLSFDFKGTM